MDNLMGLCVANILFRNLFVFAFCVLTFQLELITWCVLHRMITFCAYFGINMILGQTCVAKSHTD